MIVTGQQRVEEEFVDALRLRINPYAGVEIRRTAFNNHHQRVGVGSLRAGEQGEQCGGEQENTRHLKTACDFKTNCHPDPERAEGERSAFCLLPPSLLTHTRSFPGSPAALLP